MTTSTSTCSAPPLLPGSLACLAGKTVYLDIANGDPGRPLIKFIRKHLRKQGAIVDDFFSRSVHYVFTDRTCCSDDGCNNADVLCSNAVPSVRSYSGQNAVIKAALSMGIGVYRLATIEAWLRRNLRLMGCLSSSAGGGAASGGDIFATTTTSSVHSRPVPQLTQGSGTSNNKTYTLLAPVNNTQKNRPAKPLKPPIRLGGAFIRFHDVAGEYRPFYHEMTAWPVFRLEPVSRGASSTAAAGGSPFVDLVSPAQPSIQPGPRLEKKNVVKPAAMRGYCEACCMVVADIDRHLQGEEHAKRINRKAVTNSTSKQNQQNPVLNNKSENKGAGHRGPGKTGGEGEDFVRPLATLDAVIGQHFGPTPSSRVALLETYLEQAAGDNFDQFFTGNSQVVNFSVVEDDDDDESSSSQAEGEGQIPEKKVRVDKENDEKKPAVLPGIFDPGVLVEKLEKLVQPEPKLEEIEPEKVIFPVKEQVKGDLLDTWGDPNPEPQLSAPVQNLPASSSTCQVTGLVDSLAIVSSSSSSSIELPPAVVQGLCEGSGSQTVKKTRRLLPTLSDTAAALAKLQQEPITSSTSSFISEHSLVEPSCPSSSSSLPFELSPRKQLQAAEKKEKKPRKSRKNGEENGEKPPSKSRSKSKKKQVFQEGGEQVAMPSSSWQPNRPPSPIIPSRSAPQTISSQNFALPFTTIPYQAQIFLPPGVTNTASFQFPAAIASFLQQHQEQQFRQSNGGAFVNQAFHFNNNPTQQIGFAFNLQPQQPSSFPQIMTRRRSREGSNNSNNNPTI